MEDSVTVHSKFTFMGNAVQIGVHKKKEHIKDTENSAVQLCITVVLLTTKYSNNHCYKMQFSHVNITIVTDCMNSWVLTNYYQLTQ